MYRCLACAARFAIHQPLCTMCFAWHSLVPVGERPRADHDHEVELTDARALSRGIWQRVDVRAFPCIDVRRGALVVLGGPPGAGKSSMMVRALDSVSGPALLLSLEEPGGPTLAMRLARLGVKRSDLYIASRVTVDQLAGIVRERKIVSLGIDSVQRSMFEPRELRHLLLTLPSLAVLFAASQLNKDGGLRGSEELRHEADVVIELDAMTWRITKSRYQSVGEAGAVLRTLAEAEHAAQ